MIDWGYSINKDLQIDFDKNDKTVADLVLINEPSFALCISCGGCTATCTTANYTDFNIRMIFTLIRRGETAGLKEQIQKCMLCGKCKLVCPGGVNTRNVIYNINKALKIIN